MVCSNVVDPWQFGTDPDPRIRSPYLCLTAPDADPGGQKHTDSTDADPEHW